MLRTTMNERVRWLLTAAALVLLVLILLAWLGRAAPADDPTVLLRSSSQPAIADNQEPLHEPTTLAQIAVDVIGAVQQPGVYYLSASARVDDAVKAAGGFAPDVDRERINLAALIVDGQQIRVPRVGEEVPTSVSAASGDSASSPTLIDLNTADEKTLDTLSGVGPTIAAAIVEYRTSNGPFKRIEDVQNVSGIGPSLYTKIKDHVMVGP